MKKLLATSIGLMLSVATAAYADNYSRDRDSGDKPSSESRSEGPRAERGGRDGGYAAQPQSIPEYRGGGQGGGQRSSGGRDYPGANAYQGGGYSGGQRGGAREQAERLSGGGYDNQSGDWNRGGNQRRDDRRDGHRGDHGNWNRGGYSDGARRGGFGYGERHDGHRDGDRWRGDRHDRYDHDRRWFGDHDWHDGGHHGHGNRHHSWHRHNWYGSNWNHHRWRSPYRYSWPRGYSHYGRSWSIGLYLPRILFAPSYYVDYRPYGLQPPPYGCEWVRVDSDLLLVEIDTGLIVDVLYGFYY